MELLERIKSLIDRPVRIMQSKVIEALSEKNILIYGAGSFGREMLALLKSSSGSDEQSAPNPRAASLFMIEGFGHAFTAKKLVKPGAQEKAS